MRRVAAGALIAALFAAPVFAALSEIDTDGDSLGSFAEMSVVYSDLTEELFGEIDLNGDSFIDDAELSAALEMDLLTPMGE